MDNISSISTHVWRRARSDGMAPHRAEADAVIAMQDLYTWSEVVVRGLDCDGYDGDEGDGEDGAGLKVACNAKQLCRWLGDEEAWLECGSVLGQLKGLMDGETGEGRISEVDEENEGVNIT